MVKRYHGLSNLQSGIEPDKFILAADYDALAARLAEAERERLTAARALVKAFNELNAIRARDGVPRDYAGMKVGVTEEYFSSVVDDVDAAVLALTGRGAHCHPLLYERATDSAPAVCRHGNGPLCGVCEAEMMAGTDDSADVCDWCGGTRVLADSDGRNECPCPECTTPTADEVKS